MADKKISELTSITGSDVDDANDTIAIVDSSAGQTKKITRSELFKDVDGATFTDALNLGYDSPKINLAPTDTGGARIELGTGRAGNGNAFLDFVGDTVYTDYGLRLRRWDEGQNAQSSIEHRGSGPLQLMLKDGSDLKISRTGTTIATFDYGTDPTVLPNGTSVVTKDKGDARYAELSGATFTGAVTLGAGQNYVGNNSSSTLNFLRENGPSFLDSAKAGNELFRFRDGSETSVAQIDGAGTAASNALTLMTREKGDARYAKLDGAAFTGDVTLGSTDNEVGNTSGSNLTFLRENGPVNLYSKRTVYSSSDNLFQFVDADNDPVARISGRGPSLNDQYVVVTREKGDARYIAERGSNANGEYVRFPDGTQICTFTITSSASAAVTWTFPASFTAQPDGLSAGPKSTSPRYITFSSVTTSSVGINGWASGGSRSAIGLDVVAIGRWF